MKIKKKIICLLAIFLCILGLGSCTDKKDDNRVYAVFELEGGICQNSTKAVRYGYPIGEDDLIYIVDPNVLGKDDIARFGYKIEGWYTIKNEDGTYSDKWDFSKRTMTSEGITLYAHWVKDVSHSIQLCYINDSGEEVLLRTYPVGAEGTYYAELEKYCADADKARSGYTCVQLLDENGSKFGDTIVNPGGDKDTIVKAYATFIEGKYTRVYTGSQLIAQIAKPSNIYLMNDIDMTGVDMEAEVFGVKNYTKTFLGNGHKILNAKISYSENKMLDATGTLYFSIFNTLKDARIEDVIFENVEYDISVTFSKIQLIHFVPLAADIQNSVISNVTISGYVNYTSPKECDFEMNNPFLTKDENSEINNVIINITRNN